MRPHRAERDPVREEIAAAVDRNRDDQADRQAPGAEQRTATHDQYRREQTEQRSGAQPVCH